MSSNPPETLQESIARLLPNGLGARGDEERDPLVYPERPLHVLVACSGSVASVKIPLIVRRLLQFDKVEVQVVATKSALHFFDKQTLEDEHSGRVKVWTDAEEWAGWSKIGDPILHIELRRWADLVLVAPCSANTLAKLTHGLCDNILVRSLSSRSICWKNSTSLLRALPQHVPVKLFPAMNTHMYSHPLTSKQLAFVRDELGYRVEGPIPKRLACGDVGMGAMLEWTEIVDQVVREYQLAAIDA
ncbi:uncharacterized protein JCM15063_005709 [Sporobolomyces koalae]|uniref:uncharacterized protein n=1 Tax=Sporobolomyces koalae TaxID=500713 RepID=UPI00317FF634